MDELKIMEMTSREAALGPGAPPASSVAVKVKALEWMECPALGGKRKLIARDCFGNEFWRIDLPADNVEILKATAQTQYDKCIASALITAPLDDVSEALQACRNYIVSPLRMSRDEDEQLRRDNLIALVDAALRGYWIYNPEPGWLAEQNNIVKQPLYTAPPADAGMREALEVLLLFRAFVQRNVTRWEIGAGEHHHPMWSLVAETLGDLNRDEINCDDRWRFIQPNNRNALTAPGATTKSDGGEQPPRVGIDWQLSDDAKARLAEIDAAIVRPGDPRLNQIIGGPSPVPFTGYGVYTPITVRGSTSDPSPTRSDVTVESLAAGIERSGFVVIGRFEAAILARALLDQFEITRRKQ